MNHRNWGCSLPLSNEDKDHESVLEKIWTEMCAVKYKTFKLFGLRPAIKTSQVNPHIVLDRKEN
jgi:hypothetical protein